MLPDKLVEQIHVKEQTIQFRALTTVLDMSDSGATGQHMIQVNDIVDDLQGLPKRIKIGYTISSLCQDFGLLYIPRIPIVCEYVSVPFSLLFYKSSDTTQNQRNGMVVPYIRFNQIIFTENQEELDTACAVIVAGPSSEQRIIVALKNCVAESGEEIKIKANDVAISSTIGSSYCDLNDCIDIGALYIRELDMFVSDYGYSDLYKSDPFFPTAENTSIEIEYDVIAITSLNKSSQAESAFDGWNSKICSTASYALVPVACKLTLSDLSIVEMSLVPHSLIREYRPRNTYDFENNMSFTDATPEPNLLYRHNGYEIYAKTLSASSYDGRRSITFGVKRSEENRVAFPINLSCIIDGLYTGDPSTDFIIDEVYINNFDTASINVNITIKLPDISLIKRHEYAPDCGYMIVNINSYISKESSYAYDASGLVGNHRITEVMIVKEYDAFFPSPLNLIKHIDRSVSHSQNLVGLYGPYLNSFPVILKTRDDAIHPPGGVTNKGKSNLMPINSIDSRIFPLIGNDNYLCKGNEVFSKMWYGKAKPSFMHNSVNAGFGQIKISASTSYIYMYFFPIIYPSYVLAGLSDTASMIHRQLEGQASYWNEINALASYTPYAITYVRDNLLKLDTILGLDHTQIDKNSGYIRSHGDNIYHVDIPLPDGTITGLPDAGTTIPFYLDISIAGYYSNVTVLFISESGIGTLRYSDKYNYLTLNSGIAIDEPGYLVINIYSSSGNISHGYMFGDIVRSSCLAPKIVKGIQSPVASTFILFDADNNETTKIFYSVNDTDDLVDFIDAGFASSIGIRIEEAPGISSIRAYSKNALDEVSMVTRVVYANPTHSDTVFPVVDIMAGTLTLFQTPVVGEGNVPRDASFTKDVAGIDAIVSRQVNGKKLITYGNKQMILCSKNLYTVSPLYKMISDTSLLYVSIENGCVYAHSIGAYLFADYGRSVIVYVEYNGTINVLSMMLGVLVKQPTMYMGVTYFSIINNGNLTVYAIDQESFIAIASFSAHAAIMGIDVMIGPTISILYGGKLSIYCLGNSAIYLVKEIPGVSKLSAHYRDTTIKTVLMITDNSYSPEYTNTAIPYSIESSEQHFNYTDQGMFILSGIKLSFDIRHGVSDNRFDIEVYANDSLLYSGLNVPVNVESVIRFEHTPCGNAKYKISNCTGDLRNVQYIGYYAPYINQTIESSSLVPPTLYTLMIYAKYSDSPEFINVMMLTTPDSIGSPSVGYTNYNHGLLRRYEESVVATITAPLLTEQEDTFKEWIDSAGVTISTERSITVDEPMAITAVYDKKGIPNPVLHVIDELGNPITTLGIFYSEGGEPSTAKQYYVSGEHLVEDVEITAPADFEVSLDGSIWGAEISIDKDLVNNNIVIVHVRYNP